MLALFKRPCSLLIILLVVSTTQSVLAEPKKRLNRSIRVTSFPVTLLKKRHDLPVRIVVQGRGIGRCILRLTEKESLPLITIAVSEQGVDDQTSQKVRAFTGTAYCSHGSQPASMLLEQDVAHIDFTAKLTSKVQESRGIEITYLAGERRIEKLNFRPIRSFHASCAHTHTMEAHEQLHPQTPESAHAQIEVGVTAPAIDIALVADQSFIQKYRRLSALELAATVNAASAIYERDLGIPIRLQAVVLINKPFAARQDFSTANIRTLLRSVGKYSTSFLTPLDLDAVQLVSGQNLFDIFGSRKEFGVAGLAYVATACQQPNFSVSVIQDAPRTVRRILLAHELGHNLSAVHEEPSGAPTSGIMAPFVSSANDFFSTTSSNQILSYSAGPGLCLFEEPVLAPEDATLTLRRRGVKSFSFVAKLTDSNENPLSSYTVKLFKLRAEGQRSLVRAKFLNATGRARFRVRQRGRYQLEVSADPSALLSRVVRVR